MGASKGCVLACSVMIAVMSAQSPEPPLSESRLTVHTLLREDVFAGFLSNDMTHFARAERNVEQLPLALRQFRCRAIGEILNFEASENMVRLHHPRRRTQNCGRCRPCPLGAGERDERVVAHREIGEKLRDLE